MLVLTYAALALAVIVAAFPVARALGLPRLLTSTGCRRTCVWVCPVVLGSLGGAMAMGLAPMGPITACAAFVALAMLAVVSTPHRPNTLTLARESVDALPMVPPANGESQRARAA